MTIVVLSDDLHPNAGEAGLAGADGFVSKPFSNTDLLSHAQTLLAARAPSGLVDRALPPA